MNQPNILMKDLIVLRELNQLPTHVYASFQQLHFVGRCEDMLTYARSILGEEMLEKIDWMCVFSPIVRLKLFKFSIEQVFYK
jgi:hypothetical protein